MSCAVILRNSLAFLACAICAGAVAGDEAVPVNWSDLRGVDDESVAANDVQWKVVCFLGAECPLARLYGARLESLDREFADHAVRVVGINSNPQDSVADVKRYLIEHELSFSIIKDSDQSLARMFGATRTPEVFVLDAADHIRYQGRIDDQYEPGISRSEPTQHDLRNAIEALVNGRNVPRAKTQTVGCLITFAERRQSPVDPSAVVTFTRDVAPILNQHCVECHREGEIGPFSLTNYDEVVGWGEMILEVIDQQRMPPWHADPAHGKFVGARQMPTQARETLASWVAQGMPEGDVMDLPPQPKWIAGWHLPTAPDVEFAMRDRPFVVPSDGTVEYQYFVVDPKWEEDRWVSAAQVIPGDASVVHHAIIFVRPPDGSETDGIGWMGGYVPGQRTTMLPAGHARRIPARSKLVFQMHYTPNGRETNDTTKVGVWLSKPEQVTHEVTTRVALNHHFEIPPGERDFVVDVRLDGFARESRLLGAMPHMHLRGKSFRLDVRQHEKMNTLLWVPHYDFNWQHWYQLEVPLALGNVDTLEMQISFDNSAQNPTNPDPNEFVTWGDQTWQEMAVAFFDIAHPRNKPHVIARPGNKKTPQDQAERQQRIDDEIAKFLAQLDRDGDGVITKGETPDAFRRFGFRQIDHNRDDQLDRSEIEAEAARRLRSK
ncbi:MAG: redoxin domain-containing protein [Planctomycetaceae bacterium]|nr:redoxin domain-containing protein [Planctomycetales bacterium]MCB9922508.1 redoxin domain-containing protein [Planctomycetaceae bacterium]